MSTLRTIAGDVTVPVGTGPRIVAHVCNDVGAYDAGVAAAIRDRWPVAKQRYRDWYGGRIPGATDLALGMVQIVRVAEDLWVANMIAQSGLPGRGNPSPLRYAALAECLTKLGAVAIERGATVHMPRIGTGYARGAWDRILPLIKDRLIGSGVAVVLYDFAPKQG